MRRDKIRVVAGDHQHRHSVIVSLINRHRRVLNSNGAVQQRQHRLAFGLGITVSHGHRRFFMESGDELRHLIGRITVIDEGFLQAFETRSRIGGHVFDSEPLHRLDHEIRAGTRDQARDRGRPDIAGIAIELRLRRSRRYPGRRAVSILSLSPRCLSAGSLSFHQRCCGYQRRCSSGSSRCILKEAATANGGLL